MYHIYDILCFSFSNYTQMCKGLFPNGGKLYLAVFSLSFEKIYPIYFVNAIMIVYLLYVFNISQFTNRVKFSHYC